MDVDVNYVAVLLAALSSMVIGSIWYTPKVFGKTWMKLAGVSEKQMKEGSWAPMVSAVIRSLVTAYVLAHVIFLSNSFFQNSWLQDALSTGFWVWAGFIMSTMVMRDMFESRRKKLTLLNVANEFVTIMVMALVIGLIK